MIISFLITPSADLTAKSIPDLLKDSMYRFFSFESIKLQEENGSTRYVPLLQRCFEKDDMANATNRHLGSDYLLLKKTRIQHTNLDSTTSTAKFLHANKYSLNAAPAVFRIGNVSSTKFAYLYFEFTEDFVPIVLSLFPKLQASNSAETPAFSVMCAWFTSNGFLFEWYSNSMALIAAAGFVDAILKHWRTWNPCIYLGEVFGKLERDYNVSNLHVSAISEVSNCLRSALSKTVDGEYQEQGSANAKALSIEQLIGVFIVTLCCILGASTLFLLEWLLTIADRFESSHETFKIRSTKMCCQRKQETLVVPLYNNSITGNESCLQESGEDSPDSILQEL